MITKIISGGQTGADQAALDAAIEMGIPHGGWIPRGRLTESGPLPQRYNLQEMPTGDYLSRNTSARTPNSSRPLRSWGKPSRWRRLILIGMGGSSGWFPSGIWS